LSFIAVFKKFSNYHIFYTFPKTNPIQFDYSTSEVKVTIHVTAAWGKTRLERYSWRTSLLPSTGADNLSQVGLNSDGSRG
jgi:hypothetical protein